jgi:PAS domain S-box-containing protein
MLDRIARQIRRDREALVEKMAETFTGEIPTYANLSRASRQELERNLEDLIDLVISFLEQGGEDREETYAYARKVSQARFVQSIPFGDLVRSYYLGEAIVWGAVVQGVVEEDYSLEDWSRLFQIKGDLESDLITGLSFAYMAEKDRYINRRLQELTAMIEVGRTIAATIQLDQVLRQILEVSTAVMQVRMGGVFLVDEHTGELRLEASLGLHRPWVKGMVLELSRSLLGEAFSSGRPEAALDDGLAGLQLPALPGGMKVRSLLSCPILMGDSRIGGIELYDEQPRSYQPLDLTLLATFASQAAVAIQNARLFELEKRRREQALIAKEMAEDVARSVNYYQALGIVVHNLTSIAGVDRCTLYAYHRETGEIEFLRGFGLKAAERKTLKGLRVRAAEVDEMTRRAVEEGEMVVVEDAGSDPRVNPRNAKVFGLRSCLLVPLVYRDQVTGLACLDHTRRPHRFDRDEMDMITAAASQAATALEQLKLRESIRQKELALQEIRLKEVQFKERERSEAIINASPYAIILVDREMRITAFNPAAEELTGWRAAEALGKSCCQVMYGRDPSAGGDCAVEDCPIARAMRGDTGPLKEMEFTRRDGSRTWIGGSFSVLRNPKRRIESVVAVFRDITEQRRLEEMKLVERELEIARNIQTAQLPGDRLEHPRVKIRCRQEQARQVGGDWYDFWMKDRRLVLVIGDAAGSGMPAALMATMAMSAIRTEARRSDDLLEVIQRVNESILPNQTEDNFITVFYGEINLSDMAMRYVNAGHYDPLLVRRGSGAQFLPCRQRLILGAFELPELGLEEVKLEKGDRIILYTDGLVECRNSSRVPFGLNRLLRLVNARGNAPREKLMEEIFQRVRDFSGSPLEDDATILVCDLA